MANQFGVLFRKDWIYFKRNWISSTLEILVPIILCAIMAAIKPQIPKDTFPSVVQPRIPVPTAVTPAVLAQAPMLKYFLKNCSDTRRGGYIALVPENPVTQRLKTMFDAFNYTSRFFASNDDLNSEVASSNYTRGDYNGAQNQVCFGVVFSSFTSQNISYSLRFNTSVNGYGDMYKTQLNPRVQFQIEDQKSYNATLAAGVLSLQMMIDAFIVADNTGVQVAAGFQRFMTPQYDYSNYSGTILNMIPLLIILCTLTSYLRVINRVVTEREAKNIEHMENMGLSKGMYLLSTYVFTLITQVIVSLGVAILLKVGILFNVNWGALFLMYFLFAMALMSIGFFISSFFVSTKRALITGLVVFLVLFLFYVLKTSVQEPSESLTAFISVVPTGALTQLALNFLKLTDYFQPFGFEQMSFEVYYFYGRTFYIVCFVEWVGFTLLAFYLLYVWPHEIGVARHPLFIFGYQPKSEAGGKVDAAGDLGLTDDEREMMGEAKDVYTPNPSDFEEVEEEFRAQEKDNKTIKIDRLFKVYSNNKKAVRGLNLDIYTDQIFVLLGHNGAGKTTTISMVSGLLPISSGSITICGYDVRADHEQIKQIMGICPQVNPVFGYMTVWEHLQLYGNIKGVNEGLEEEAKRLLTELDLYHKKDYLADKLSGGQKRKLCVAMAFIGGSKVVLLDEPTSGLDTYARRHLWEMLKKYKKDRLIILTTHNMDEADFLGDRIGIMSDGRMMTCGSPIFLKRRFGDGYELTVLKSAEAENSSMEGLKQLVRANIPNSKVISEIGSEVKFRLPENPSGFRTLFEAMERDQAGLGIQSFGIDMNTLEDVFIKVARLASGRPLTAMSSLTQSGLPKVSSRVFSPDDPALSPRDNNPLQMDLRRLTDDNPGLFSQQLKALIMKRYLNVVRDWSTIVCEIFLPIFVVVIGLAIAKIRFFVASPPLAITPDIYPGRENFTANTLGPTPQSDPVASLVSRFDPANFGYNQTGVMTLDAFNAAILAQNSTTQLFSLYFSGIAANFINYTLLFNTTAPFVPFLAVNELTNAIIRANRAANPSAAALTVSFMLEPLGLTKSFNSLNATASGFIVVILIIQAFALIPNSLIQFIVKERENNSKHQQVVSGTSVGVYWLSNFIVDYVKYIIPGVIIYALFYAFGADFFYEGAKAGYTIFLILLYGVPLILLTYCLSFLFTSPGNAQIFAYLLFSFLSFILVVVSFVLKIIPDTRDPGLNIVPYVFNLITPFSLGDAFMNMANDFLYTLVYKWGEVKGPFEIDIGGQHLIYLACFSVFYLGLLALMEQWFVVVKALRGKKVGVRKETGRMDRSQTRNDGSNRVMAGDSLDEDVLLEEETVKKQTKAYSVFVEDLQKRFKVPGAGFCESAHNKWAVNGVTFGVEQGSVFCLLGTNGAGKTTTFKILTGDINATDGRAVIRGLNLPEDLSAIRQLVGYCPQFDSLSEKLTAQEHLQLYCDLKGIHPRYHSALIENMLTSLNLTPYRNVQAETYSGGNKRKLSIAIALIGQPPIVFLDEPSAGMDPEARRFMWNFIAEISTKRAQSSIILTTHSMEEAQALSSKVAIMVEGKIKTIGTIQRLKDKYGRGFEVEIKLALPAETLIAEKTRQYQTLVRQSKPEVFTANEVTELLNKTRQEGLLQHMTEGGRGSAIHQRLKVTGSVEERVLVEWIEIQASLARVEAALRGRFELALVEAFQSYAKFNISDKHRLSEVFGFLESELPALDVANFAVREISLEQIFIQFAHQIVHED